MSSIWYLDYWSENWEDMCNILLALKHGPDYEPISDKGGDMGLDGLVVANGIAYQAYGQEPENKDPTNGVKNKINKDLTKLKKYERGISAVLKGEKISHWILLLNKEIPNNNIHEYIKNKQTNVRSWGLSFIADDFQASVQPPSYLHTEYLEFKKKRDDHIEVDIDEAPAPSFVDIMGTSKFIAVLDKFKKIVNEETAAKLAYDTIKAHFENAAQLDQIQIQEPDFYSQIEEVRSDVEEDAQHGSIMEGTHASYANTMNTLETRLNNKIGDRLGTSTLKRVRKFVISDWLVRCPLDFKDRVTKS